MNRDEELLKVINKWLYHNEKLRQINKYLYEHTELFEQQYMTDYLDELYAFFAGKITRFTRDYNLLTSKLSQKQLKKLRQIQILEN